jgi:hypothetical protein
MAKGTFDTEVTEYSKFLPQVDYRTLMATVCVELDQVLYWKTEVVGGDPDRKLVVRYPHAEAWVVLAGTVKDVKDDGTLDTTVDDEVVHTDADRLAAAGAYAKGWYGTPRTVLDFTFDSLAPLPVELSDAPLKPGMLVGTTAAGGETHSVNSVVTTVSYDLEHQATRYATGWEELDFANLGGLA